MSLEYDVSFHLRCRISLPSGRNVRLNRLEQWQTYAGLLEGAPDARLNDHIIESAVVNARPASRPGGALHVVRPVRRGHLRTPGDMTGLGIGASPEWLPMVTCIGVFESTVVRQARVLSSTLTMLWFQDEFALPILEPGRVALETLDWDALATEDGP